MHSNKAVRVLRALAAPALFASMVSCINEDYDLSDGIDMTVDFYGDLSLPIGSTEFIPIGDFLELNSEEQSVINTDEKGNYFINFNGDKIRQSVQIDPINLSSEQLIQNGGFTVNLPVKSEIGNVIDKVPGIDIDQIPLPQRPGEIMVDIPVKSADTYIEIDENVAEAAKTVKSIRKISVNAPVFILLKLGNFNGLGKVTLKKGFRIVFPKCIAMQKSDNSDYFVIKDNVIEFVKPVELTESHALRLNFVIDSIDFQNLPDGQGLVGDYIKIYQPITLSGLEVKADASDFGTVLGDIPDNLDIDIVINVSSMSVESASAVIEPDFQIDPQTFAIGELPEFLSSDNIVLDIYNPLISFSVDNSAPVTALLNADIVPKFKASPDGSAVHLGSKDAASQDAIIIKPGYTDVYISQRGYEVPDMPQNTPSDWNTPLNIVVENLSDIIKTIPDSLSLNNVKVDVPHKGNSVTGYYPEDYTLIEFDSYSSHMPVEYDFSVDYSVSAPLSFGKDLNIEYSTDIKDWNSTFNPSEESDGSPKVDIQEAVISIDFINAIPLTMEVSAVPIDIKGNEMNSKDISVKLEGKVKGGNIGNETTTPLQIAMSATPEALKRFDGLRINIVATSPDPDFQGVCLNKNQGIRLAGIKAKLKGGVSIDLNVSNE